MARRFASGSLAGTGSHFPSASAPRDSGFKSASPDSGKEARTERKWKGWTPIAATDSSWTARWRTIASRTKTGTTWTRRAERSVSLPTAAIRTSSTRAVTSPIEERPRTVEDARHHVADLAGLPRAGGRAPVEQHTDDHLTS